MIRTLRRRQLVGDIVVAVVFAAIALPLELTSVPGAPLPALSAVLTVGLLGAALALRRLSPTLSLAAAWAGALAQMAFQRPPTPTDVAIFAVLYASAAYGSRRVFWAGLASTIVGAVLITGYLFAPVLADGRPLDGSLVSTAFLTLVAALFGLGLSWTVGALVRTGIRARENRRAQERAETEARAEQERVRIARDMHDVVAHSLAVVIAQADGARYAVASDPDAATAALGTISATARAALSDVRVLLTQLRQTAADPGDAPQPMLADLESLYAQVRAAGVDLRVDVDPAPPREIPAAVQLAVYRILQEALTNALRHGGGPVEVALAWHPERVDLSVRNPLPPAPAPPGGGHGLIGMRERAQLVGGTLTAGPDAAHFAVHARLPLPGARA